MLCPECKQEKDVSRFIWKPNGKQARKPCRDCLNKKQLAKYHADPQWRAAHRARCDDWEARNSDVRIAISRRYRERNPGKAAAATRAWIEKNRDHLREYMREWNSKNKPRANARRRELRATSPEYREKNNAILRARYRKLTPDQIAVERKRFRDYSYVNRPKLNAKQAKRRGAVERATPSWGQDGIEELYKLAAEHGFHVDHIVPLKGKLVSGLHVIFNLQLLPPVENFVKNNKFDPDAYIHSIPGENS